MSAEEVDRLAEALCLWHEELQPGEDFPCRGCKQSVIALDETGALDTFVAERIKALAEDEALIERLARRKYPMGLRPDNWLNARVRDGVCDDLRALAAALTQPDAS